MNGQRRTDGGEKRRTRTVEAAARSDQGDESGSLDELREKLRTVKLRSREMTVTITDVQEVSTDGDDRIRVSYERGNSEGTDSFEGFDEFAIPDADSERYEFVRLCQFLHVPLERAHEDLVGLSLSARWDDGDWTLRYSETDYSETDYSDVEWGPFTFDDIYVLSFLLAVVPTSIVFLPLVSPLLFERLSSRTRTATAAGITIVSLLVWTVVAGFIVSVTGVLEPFFEPL